MFSDPTYLPPQRVQAPEVGRATSEKPWYARATLPPRIGVVIPTRNRADLLPHMLGSVIVQSHRPEKILVVDDGGSDHTPQVVARYAGVDYLRADVGDGTSGNPARNVGLRELAHLPYLCFLDDDDMIPPYFLQKLLEAIETDCRAAAAYPRMYFCGKQDLVWERPWDPPELGRTNFSGVPALIRTDALLQVGGWPTFSPHADGTVPHDDWALWRRFRDHGWQMVPSQVDYFYHRHDGGVCESKARANHRMEWRRTIDPLNLVTLAIPWSGRLYLLDEVLEAIESQTFPPELLHVLFYDNSGSEECGRRLRAWLLDHGNYAGHTYIRDPRPAVEGRTAVEVADAPLDPVGLGRRRYGRMLNDRVGAIWNRIGQLVNTDLVWCVEDDVIPPPEALDRLMDRMNAQLDAVTGSYRSRVVPGRCVAWNYTNLETGALVHLPPGKGVERIGGCGMGCALVRRDVFQAGPARSAGEAVGYDCNLWLDVARRGGVLVMDWGLSCEHRIEACAGNGRVAVAAAAERRAGDA